MAKNVFLDWSTTASSNTDVGGIGILGTNAVSNFDDALRTIMAQLRAGVDGEMVYAAKSGNYTAVANDNNAVHIYTATATVTLTAAATLAANWHYTVVANGAAVTIDPNASETINGLATLIVPDGSTAKIVCDGTNFFTIIRPTAWVTIGAPITLSGQSVVDWTDLGSYRHLKMTLECSVSTAANIFMRVSTNNGSSFLSGASDYAFGLLSAVGGTPGAAAVISAASLPLTNVAMDSSTQSNFTVDITNFNKNLASTYKTDGAYANSSVFRRELDHGNTAGLSARNALRLFTSAGNFAAGQVTLEGIRG